MIKKINNNNLIIFWLIIVCSLPLITHALIGKNFHYIGDDYGVAYQLNEHGFFGSLIWWYQNWSGEIIVNFIVSDGEYYIQNQFLVGVIEIDDPPVVYDVSSTTPEDEVVIIDLVASDPDTESESLVYSIVSEATHGSVSIQGSSIEYTPDSNYNGSDQLSYSVSDGSSDSNTANIDIDIIPINDSPTAQDIEYSVSSDSFEFDLNCFISLIKL